MSEEIINRVANSKLITLDLEDYYHKGERILFDIKDWLLEGLVLREKDFRQQAIEHNWQQYKNCYVALTCSTEAIIPAWAYMLLSTYLGLLGVVLVLVAYVLLQAQKLSQNSALFYVINLIGSILILGSLYFHPNLPSVVIEIAWLIISVLGIWRCWFRSTAPTS